ncbi:MULTISPECIES: adenylate/guanylate cyclase domain-containing protein [Nocardioides]|uniref:Adenylate/guanylate cyclase domain-containing protein n=1 Tax=Nocardioides vastitatis TaxID=2568655 RepID=A0ABW0ZCA5_9ACTN|nr:adenylate/guanylate cyclase domain-containing protein [Nocardioides sp.]THI95658.1 adenylate/guanylate cyclase domain-containing protein [Nocardioides sp.]
MGVRLIRSWLQDRHAQLHMRPWLLQFDDTDVERAFVAHDNAEGVREARPAIWVAVVFTAAYGLIDPLVVDEGRAYSAIIRFGILVPVMLVILVGVGRWAAVERHFQAVIVGLVSLIILLLGVGLAWAAPYPEVYLRTSGTVTLLGAIGLLRLRMHATIAVTAVFVAVHVVVANLRPLVADIVADLAPTAGLAAIALVVGYALERLRRTDFLRQREVERERERSDELLHNVLPVTIALRLRTERGAIADSAADVSVLFSDIVGFTPVAEMLEAEELVQLLDTMFTEFDALCDRRGVEKIKTVGDAYMAVAGLPLSDDHHAESLAELALDMQRASSRLAADWPSPIAMRIGIASGPVVAGVIGQRKFAYDLWGDTVNTASRMESHGLPNRIQVSESTYTLLEHRYVFSAPRVIQVKGKGPMRTYFLLGKAP